MSTNDSLRMEELNDELVSLSETMKSLQARADAEGRDVTEDEAQGIEVALARFKQVEDEIERRNRIADTSARVSAPLGRVTDPDDAVSAARQDGTRRQVPAQPRNTADALSWGFRSLGEFLSKVRDAAVPGGSIDPRIIANTAPGDFAREGVGSEGGVAIPPDYRREIREKVFGEDSLISRTDQQVSSSNQITVPTDETTPWQTSGGIQAYWTGEGAQKTPSKPNLGQTTVRLEKLTSLVPVTDEMLEDGAQLASYIRSKAPQKMTFKMNDAIINGTGAGMPLGIMNAPALVTVDGENDQDADTVQFPNIVKMWSRLYAPSRRNAVWLVNQDVEPQLMSMQFPGTGTAVPVYLPPGGLSAAPYGTLLGRPVIPTEACGLIGDPGDIILADLSQYLAGVKTGGIRQDTSMHIWFDYDITAFRFVLRVGGQPWWGAPIARKDGNNTNTWSAFVALGARVGSA